MNFAKRLSIDYLHSGYKSGCFTPKDICNEIIKRVEKYSEKNIWITKPNMNIMLKYIDRLGTIDIDKYPLWGIPFAIKDNIDLEQTETTAACKAYAYKPVKSAFVVQKLIDAGAIPVGKTNLDQFATGLVGTRSPYGEVHNSLNDELISGGSSSGSAVAVSLGLCSFALGTDTAGSGRIPAALNCIVGYKPSLGAWSTSGVVPACASLDCVTVFSVNIADAEKVNECARGFDLECSWSRKFGSIIKKLPKKILLAKNNIEFYGDYGEIYNKKWNRAVDRIKNMGIEVEYIDYTMFSKVASILYDGPWIAERWKDIGRFVENNPNKVFHVTEKILRMGAKTEFTASKLFEAIHTLKMYKQQADNILKDAVLIMPTAGGTFTREQVRNNPIETNSKMGLYTNHCNLLDLCAINIPENSNDFSIPFGITVFAEHNSEGIMLEFAEKFLENERMDIAVCGLHKKGFPLEYQLTELGGKYVETVKTSDKYRLYKLNTNPQKPGLIKSKLGNQIEVDIFSVPINKFGWFMQNVASPLCIGDVELNDGRVLKGFIAESICIDNAKDITDKGRFDVSEILK
ncbi:MAG: allophanate hydrolase [Clostridia bacterium]|nr:allophanate hydrolase [Clostridia bacterium]